MSIKRMSAVWEHSIMTGNDLLLMLAIADNAADDGYCWPSLETLAHKTRMHRTTVMRCIQRCELVGELYVRHSRRYGNRYLVLVGLEMPQIQEALTAHFALKEEALSSAVLLIKETLSKSQVVRLQKLQAMRLQKSQAVRHDPSKNRQETRQDVAPKNGAIKPSTKRKREPGVLKTLEELTPMQRTVATEIFSLREGQRASKKTMVLINMVLSELYARFGKEHVTPEQLRAALAWYMARPGAVRPKDGAKVANMVSDYLAQHRPAAASAIVRDPDCAVCGGTGLVLPALGAYEDGDPRANTPIQCPVCVKAARASEAQREAVGL